MDNPADIVPPRLQSPNAGLVQLEQQAITAIVDTPGRRGVKVYALSREQMAAVGAIVVFVGLPSLVFLSLIPLWETIGRLPIVSALTSYTAPSIAALDYSFRSDALPRFPLKRFFIAASSMVEILFLANFALLLFKRMRRRALLVWLCFDRTHLLRMTLISGVALVGLWCLFFSDWTILRFLGPSRGGEKLIIYAVFALPNVALVSGHLAAIVTAGAARSLQKQVRRRFWQMRNMI